jgi:hypothetical protein
MDKRTNKLWRARKDAPVPAPAGADSGDLAAAELLKALTLETRAVHWQPLPSRNELRRAPDREAARRSRSSPERAVSLRAGGSRRQGPRRGAPLRAGPTLAGVPPAPGRRPRNSSPARAGFAKEVVAEGLRRGVDYGALRTVPESHYSCLLPRQMDDVERAYATELKHAPASILDATANVGCDAIQFRRMYPAAEITAVEVDAPTAATLRANMASLPAVLAPGLAPGLPPGSGEPPGPTAHAPRAAGGTPAAVAPITVLEGDCVSVLEAGRRADLVYFDPPWGGPEYYRAAALHLELSGRPLGEVVGAALARNAPLVVVKAPFNADVGALLAEAARVWGRAPACSTHPVGRRRKGNEPAYVLHFLRAPL